MRWPEPFGMVMIEALACGTPVVAYRYATAPEIVDHGVTGFLCDGMDDLTAKLTETGRAAGGVRRAPSCLHTASMPNVLVRDVPDDVHAALQQRAEARGQSLQQYLTSELRRLAEQPSLEEVLGRIDRRQGGRVGLGQAAADLADERSRP
ncbi:MAG TPA: glycosyltransferase [Acidimicrobiales bacterium]